MKYTVILTEEANGNFYATVPGLPDCQVEAPTRREVLHTLRERISMIVSRSEILQLDIPTAPKAIDVQRQTPWEWFGKFHGDQSWGQLFDEIEEQKDFIDLLPPDRLANWIDDKPT